MPKIIGHRGDAKYFPENTIVSFESAYEKGADIIELDVQLSKDGYIVVCHDYTIDRTSNMSGYLSSYTLRELKEADFGSWFSKKNEKEKIPTLAEVFKHFRLFDIEFNIEIKSTKDNYGVIENKLYDLIKRHDMLNRVYISGFNHFSLKFMKELDNNIRTGILYTAKMINPEKYANQIRAYSLNPNYLTVEGDMIKKSKEAGIKIFPYTVNKEDDMRKLVEARVDGIITDDPGKLKKIKNIIMEE